MVSRSAGKPTGTGRPRADGVASTDPRGEIIAVATRLFASRGIAQTTMTAIAEEVGLRQASLYYWFKNKDELLQATSAVNRSAVEVVQALQGLDCAPDVALYRLLYDDTRFMCLGPVDYHEIERMAFARPEHFADFWADYRRLYEAIRDLLVRGAETGSLIKVDDIGWESASALATNEAAQKLYRYGRRGAEHYLPLVEVDLSYAACGSADKTVGNLLRERGALPSVRRQALHLPLPGSVSRTPDSAPAPNH